MMDDLYTKKGILTVCEIIVKNQIQDFETNIKHIREAANNETKSSAGDKYETGRAMMQMENDKLARQLNETRKIKNVLDHIDAGNKLDMIQLGAVIYTNLGNYFLAVSLGKIVFEEQEYFAMSPASPIGQLLFNKKVGDVFLFNNKKVVIEKVI